MIKNMFLLCLTGLISFSCKNKGIENRKKEISEYIQQIDAFNASLTEISDTSAYEALKKIKIIEKDFKHCSSKFADTLSHCNIYNLKNHSDLNPPFSKAITKRIALMRRLIDKKYEFQMKSLANAKTLLDSTEVVLKDMKPSPVEEMKQMQEETRMQHEKNKKQYKLSIANFKAERDKGLKKLKEEAEILDHPEKLLTLF